MDKACSTQAVLVAYSLDRLARNTRDAIDILEKLRKNKADLASITESLNTRSAIGQFLFELLASFAQLQRRQIVERTSSAMRHYQKNGRRMGRLDRCPYGKMPDPNGPKVKDKETGLLTDRPAAMIDNPQEQAVIERIRRERGHNWGYTRMTVTMPTLKVRKRLRFWFRSSAWEHFTSRPRPILRNHRLTLEALERRENTNNLFFNPLAPNLLDPGDIRLAGPQLGEGSGQRSTSPYAWRTADAAAGHVSAPHAPEAPSSGAPRSFTSAASISQETASSLSAFSVDLFTIPGAGSSSSHSLQGTSSSLSSSGSAVGGGSSAGGFGGAASTSSGGSGSTSGGGFAVASSDAALFAAVSALPAGSKSLGTPAKFLGLFTDIFPKRRQLDRSGQCPRCRFLACSLLVP